MATINTKKVKALISARIEQEKDYQREHSEIMAFLKGLEGESISGRKFNNELKKKLPAYKADHRYGMYHLQGKYSHLIGYQNSGSGLVNAEKFADWDACNGLASEERVKQMESIDIKEIVHLFGRVEKSYNELRALFGDIETMDLGSYSNPIYYELLRAIACDK